MNKNLLIGLAVIVLVILGYFALKDNNSTQETSMSGHSGMQSMAPSGMTGDSEMDQLSESQLEIFKENVEVPFNQSYKIDDDWTIDIIQFEPDAKIVGPGSIASDSDQEVNPAVKVNFYKDGELAHYQIVFKEMPGFHSVKPDQKYLLDLIDYSDYKTLGDNKFAINNANLKIWRIK